MDAQDFLTSTNINRRGVLDLQSAPNLHLGLCFSRWCARMLHRMTQSTMGTWHASGYKCMHTVSPLPRPHPLHTMAPPSSCHISGVFSLSDGSRSTEPSYYATYLSALEFIDDEKFINVSVRKFTASTDTLYTDDSFVFLVAKAVLPAGEDGMLDSIYCTPFVSPPEGFESFHPPGPTHTASVTGTVSSVNTNGSTRSFTLTTSEYVRDERRTFTVRFVSPQIPDFQLSLMCLHFSFEYDGTSSRWKNVRLPVTGSTVMAIGTFQDVSGDGHGEPVLSLLDISYGMAETVSASPTRTVGHRKTVR